MDYQAPSRELEEMLKKQAKILRARFSIGRRLPRPRRETPLALAARLPEVGVAWTHTHGKVTYSLRVLGPATVECEGGGETRNFRTLKSLARAITGKNPPIGGWKYFFGGMSRADVTAKWKKA